VNFLKLRKNMKETWLAQLCHSEIELWRHCGGGDAGKFKCGAKVGATPGARV